MKNEFKTIYEYVLNCPVYTVLQLPEGTEFLGMEQDQSDAQVKVWYLQPVVYEKLVSVEFLSVNTGVTSPDLRGRYLGRYLNSYGETTHVFFRELEPESI